MQIGVPKESAEGERRVALVPEVVSKLSSGDGGIKVVVERGAGAGALIPDAQYEEAGARMVEDPAAVWESDVVVKVATPAAKNESGSPIYGMPFLEVDRSGPVIVLKRSMASGFAGIDSPLFYDPRTALPSVT